MFCKGCRTLIHDDYNFCPVCGRETHPAPKAKPRRPKGGGCVSKLSGNRQRPWRAIKNGVCLGTFATENEASLHLLKYQGKEVTATENITLEGLYQKWMGSGWYGELSGSMQDGYKAAWNYLSLYKSRKFTTLKTAEYQEAIYTVTESGRGRSTAQKVASLASNLCKYAMTFDLIPRNYASGLRLTKSEATQKRNFTDIEILTLFYNDDLVDAKICLCLLYSGVRETEFFRILKSNVHLEERYMVGGAKTESGRNRIIPIRNEILEYISYFYNLNDSKYLVTNSKGGPMTHRNFLRRRFYPLMDLLKISYKNEEGANVLTPYRSRHTFIAENIKAGVRPEILKKVVGHASYSTTVDKYDEVFDLEYIRSQIQVGM